MMKIPSTRTLLLPWLLAATPTANLEAQGVLRGTVTDGTRPLPGVELRLVREDDATEGRLPRIATTGDSGRFRFESLVPGTYSIAARRIGFQLQSRRLTLNLGQQLDLSMVLSPVAQSLDTVAINAEADITRRYGGSSRMAEFHARRARGVGQFVTREELQQNTTKGMEDILRRVRGLRIRRLADGSLEVVSARCQGNSIRPSRPGEVSFTGTQVYVNGTRLDWRTAGEVLASFHADDIEGIEVYRGPSELPVDAVGDACAAIFIWTRVGS